MAPNAAHGDRVAVDQQLGLDLGYALLQHFLVDRLERSAVEILAARWRFSAVNRSQYSGLSSLLSHCAQAGPAFGIGNLCCWHHSLLPAHALRAAPSVFFGWRRCPAPVVLVGSIQCVHYNRSQEAGNEGDWEANHADQHGGKAHAA